MALKRKIHFSVYSDLNRKINEEQNRYREEAKKNEGRVTIDTSKSANKKTNSDDGEYVDYTEIK
jgi:hypothetical protein